MADPVTETENSTPETPATVTASGRIPGDLTREQLLDRICRVDLAGEYGAVRIYTGQLAVLGRGPQGKTIRHMRDQEVVHRAYFEKAVARRQARPTAMQPIWHVAGWALGAATALMGERAAMACTVAVEEAIDEHYTAQIEALGDDQAELREQIKVFRAEELEHRDIGYAEGAEEAVGYTALSTAIKAGTRLAIWLSERI